MRYRNTPHTAKDLLRDLRHGQSTNLLLRDLRVCLQAGTKGRTRTQGQRRRRSNVAAKRDPSRSSSWPNQQASSRRYGHVRPRQQLATRAGQHVWPRTRPTEDDVEAVGSSRATSGHDLSPNAYGELLLLFRRRLDVCVATPQRSMQRAVTETN